jgi:ribosomal protein S18 acetylase RimI-like enzyme
MVHRLAVSPEFRGAGVAATLMRKAEEVAVERGLPAVRTDTSIENEAAQRLFLKMGYVQTGEISLSFRPGLRVLCYEKRLS